MQHMICSKPRLSEFKGAGSQKFVQFLNVILPFVIHDIMDFEF